LFLKLYDLIVHSIKYRVLNEFFKGEKTKQNKSKTKHLVFVGLHSMSYVTQPNFANSNYSGVYSCIIFLMQFDHTFWAQNVPSHGPNMDLMAPLTLVPFSFRVWKLWPTFNCAHYQLCRGNLVFSLA